MDTPTEYSALWQKRYAELIGHGVPEEKAKALASELAAAAILATVQGRSGGGPPPLAAPAAPVLKWAKFDGYGLLIMGVPSMIISVFSASVVGFLIGAAVTACGWAELDGFRRYMKDLPGSRKRLVGSQVALVVCAWAYAGWTLIHPAPLPPEITELINESGEQASDVIAMTRSLAVVVAAAICGITLIYQGGLAYYYWKKTRGRP